jgi:hypothetical protein
MDSVTARLLQAIEGFMEQPPRGVPQEVLEGLNNLSEGLRGGPEGDESPGQQAVRDVGAEPESRKQAFGDDDSLSPGQRAAIGAS